MKYLLLGMLLVLSGCAPQFESDPELRQRLFFECLGKIPKGPEHTKYNDWDEVVEVCGREAYYLSFRRVE